jgi:hypothetical protein
MLLPNLIAKIKKSTTLQLEWRKRKLKYPTRTLFGSLDTHNIIFRNVEFFPNKIKREFVKENIASSRIFLLAKMIFSKF